MKGRKVKKWTVPKTVEQVLSLQGIASYYRRFVEGFAKIAYDMDGQLCLISDPESRLTTSHILAYPVPGQSFILDMDASQQAVGAVLSQEPEGKEHVVALTHSPFPFSILLILHEQSFIKA